MHLSGYIIFLVICGLMKEGLQWEPQLKPCQTGHGKDGSCLTRAYCKVGSSAVDTSLYEPSGYKKICSAEEVCCLLSNIIPQTTDPNKDNDNDSFNFDDDDD